MRNFDNILNLLTPDYLVHTSFKLTNRPKRQHFLGIICIALCMLVVNANMGQAGVGAINQAKVSNYSPVPPNAVITQPKMLFLFLNHHFNRPSLEISAFVFNGIYGKPSVGLTDAYIHPFTLFTGIESVPFAIWLC